MKGHNLLFSLNFAVSRLFPYLHNLKILRSGQNDRKILVANLRVNLSCCVLGEDARVNSFILTPIGYSRYD